MYTVLVADDEDNIRLALINAVNWTQIGFNIIGEATNGVEALDFLEHNDVDLLVSDIKMPIMDGIELAKKAKEIRPSIQIVFLSGYDHFEFAKKAIHYNILEYILKPITAEQIKKEFTEIRKKLDYKFAEVMNIDNQIDALKEIKEVKQKLYLVQLIHNAVTMSQTVEFYKDTSMSVPLEKETNNYYVVSLVKFRNSSEEDTSELAYKRLENITRIISTKYITCECFLYGTQVVVVGYGNSEILDKYLSILSMDIVFSAKRIMNMDVCFAQSNYYEELLLSHLAYEEAYDAITCIEHTEEQFVHIKDLVSKPDDTKIHELLHTIEPKIIAGNKKDVENIINNIFTELQVKQVNSTQFNTYILEILAVLFKTKRMLNDELEVKSAIAKFVSFQKSKEIIQNEILDLSISLVDGIANQRQKSVGNLVSNALGIIDQEYSNPEISLGLLAERLHCSPNYLSGNIKKTLGKSFVELLVEARMKRAKELLLTTNIKIREVSEMCGFANQHYFSYSFKKYYNVSPNVIRKQVE